MERLDHVLDAVVDSGECGEVPTTVVDLSNGEAVIVRRGAGDPRGSSDLDGGGHEQGFFSTVQQTAETFVAQLMRSKLAVGLLSVAPIPLFLVRSMLARQRTGEPKGQLAATAWTQ